MSDHCCIRYISMLTIFACLLSSVYPRTTTTTISSFLPINGARSTADPADRDRDTGDARMNEATSSTGIWKDLSHAYRVYRQCSHENLSVCLKIKLLAGLERAMRSRNVIQLGEGIQLVQNEDNKTEELPSQTTLLNEKDIEAILPRSLEAKEQTLSALILKRFNKLLQNGILNIQMPFLADRSTADDMDSNSVEGRKKKDKKGGGGAFIMIPLLLGGTFVPIAYGALAMLAGKALIVSKLALVLASIIGIKKLLSHDSKESSHEVVVSGGGHSGWGRDMDLAYSGWRSAKDTRKPAAM